MSKETNRKGISAIGIILIAMAVLAGVAASTAILLSRRVPTAQGTPEDGSASSGTAGWKTYRNYKYGFELKYPPDFKIEFSSSSKMTGLGICIETRCEKFLAVYEEPLPLVGPKYQKYREIETPNDSSNTFYYYGIRTSTTTTDQILSTLKFIK